MGGTSSGTFSIQDGVGVMEGTVAGIPFLKGAPGFIKMQTSDSKAFADVSSCTGITLNLKSTSTPSPYDGYRVAFGSDRSSCGKFFARGFKADFAAPVGEFGEVKVPFNMFSNCWDDATGDAITTCADDASKCPPTSRLQKLQTMSIWAEGKLGDVKLEVKSVGAYGCGSTLAEDKPNIVELAQSVDDLSTLVAAVVAGDLAETLSSPGPFTVFAPTNEAFGALPEGTLDSLLKPENKDQLVDILTYHVLPAQVLSTDLKFFQSVATVEGKNVHVVRTSKGVYVGPSIKELKSVVGADNLASNGVAHIIDGVLLPPTSALADSKPNIVELAQSVDDLSTLVAAVVAGDLAETLSSPGPFTVFAPTNEAFGSLPEGTLDSLLKPENKDQLVDILTYHVLPAQVLSTDLKFFQSVATVEGKNVHVVRTSKGVYVGPSIKELKSVVGADNLASNGVAHIIDGVLLPPTSALADSKPNIVELAQSVDDLSTLVAAVVAGDLAETLSSPGPFTVFAPTNEAFGALPAGTLDTLLKPENKDQLVDILTYHVLPAQVLSTDLKPKQVVKTVEGKELLVSIYNGDVYANKAKVVGADNLASNGVAHIIDGVLLPKTDAMTV